VQEERNDYSIFKETVFHEGLTDKKFTNDIYHETDRIKERVYLAALVGIDCADRHRYDAVALLAGLDQYLGLYLERRRGHLNIAQHLGLDQTVTALRIIYFLTADKRDEPRHDLVGHEPEAGHALGIPHPVAANDIGSFFFKKTGKSRQIIRRMLAITVDRDKRIVVTTYDVIKAALQAVALAVIPGIDQDRGAGRTGDIRRTVGRAVVNDQRLKTPADDILNERPERLCLVVRGYQKTDLRIQCRTP